MHAFDTVGLVAQIAWRNLLANRWKTLIVGGIIGFGALLVVVGGSMLDGVEQAMSRSIVGSVAGHIQVYSRESKDELDIMGGISADAPDIAPLDFDRLKRALAKESNIAALVPMGISSAIVSSGNSIDQALSRLRQSADRVKSGESSPELLAQYRAQIGLVRQIVEVLQHDLENARKISDGGSLDPEQREAVATTASAAFWDGFEADPFGHLELLENRIAPIATDADMLFLRYLGTDPAAFARHFDRMKVVDGEPIPVGQRGFMFSKYIYEEQIKLKTARGLDKIKQARKLRHAKIAQDPELQRVVRENSTGVRELLLQLDGIKSQAFRVKLQGVLHSQQTDLSKLLSEFFNTNDDNFDARYAFFYKELAPSLELYRVRIGDTLTIKSFTRSGYVQSANLKVYGTFAFAGLEESPQAGALNMMDLVSFRELYGFMTAEREQEITAMRAAAGAKDVARDSIEADLFGAPSAADEADTAAPATPGEAAAGAEPAAGGQDALAALAGTRSAIERRGASYDPQQLQSGVVLNAAVLLRDESRLDQTMKAIERVAGSAGLSVHAISWQKAAGLIGQFATLMRAILYAAVLIIFMVGLVVINNALVMATLERVGEIGTLRAIGAQRRLVLGMLIIESAIVGLVFGTLGALIGAAILLLLGKVGIPAVNDVLTFFFSGSHLYPAVTTTQMVFSLGIVVVVSVVSGIYPALVAMRVSPRQAMQAEE